LSRSWSTPRGIACPAGPALPTARPLFFIILLPFPEKPGTPGNKPPVRTGDDEETSHEGFLVAESFESFKGRAKKGEMPDTEVSALRHEKKIPHNPEGAAV
jgi:hypothetical protein